MGVLIGMKHDDCCGVWFSTYWHQMSSSFWFQMLQQGSKPGHFHCLSAIHAGSDFWWCWLSSKLNPIRLNLWNLFLCFVFNDIGVKRGFAHYYSLLLLTFYIISQVFGIGVQMDNYQPSNISWSWGNLGQHKVLRHYIKWIIKYCLITLLVNTFKIGHYLPPRGSKHKENSPGSRAEPQGTREKRLVTVRCGRKCLTEPIQHWSRDFQPPPAI